MYLLDAAGSGCCYSRILKRFRRHVVSNIIKIKLTFHQKLKLFRPKCSERTISPLSRASSAHQQASFTGSNTRPIKHDASVAVPLLHMMYLDVLVGCGRKSLLLLAQMCCDAPAKGDAEMLTKSTANIHAAMEITSMSIEKAME